MSRISTHSNRSRRRRALILSATVLAVTTAVTVLLLPGAAQAASSARVTGVGSGRCVDVPRSDVSNGNQLTLWACNGGANQQVALTSTGRLGVLGKCLDARARGRSPGTQVVLWDCTGGGANQQWRVDGDRIVGVDSGLCLDAFGKGTANATPLVLWTCNGGTNQAWKIEAAGTAGPVPAPGTTSPVPAPGTTGPVPAPGTTSPVPAPGTTAPGTTAPGTTAPGTTAPVPAPGTTAPTGPPKTLSVGTNLGAHDPSRIIEDQGSYYFWATGGGGWRSTDGTHWTRMPNLFPGGFPSAVTAVLPQNSGVWAPDVIWNPNSRVYDMYYSVALWGDTQHSLTGLITSPTLDPASPDYHWTDRGIVIQQAPPTNNFGAIDPMPFFDAHGAMWLSLGSGYGSEAQRAQGINIVSLDKNTGLLGSDKTIYTQLSCGCEGSAVDYHGGYYYLFWNTGGCCDGASSTYLIHVARSTSVTGPYTGSRTFLASTGDRHGPGHIGFISQNGTDYYTYHYYPDSGGSVMGLDVLTWSADGWPVSSPR